MVEDYNYLKVNNGKAMLKCYLKKNNKRFKCVILMHTEEKLFNDTEAVIQFCNDNQIRYFVKPLDNPGDDWKYSINQYSKLKKIWIKSVPESKQNEYLNLIDNVGKSNSVSSINEGRMCCGGRKLSLNGDLKSCVSFVPKQGFTDWYCSVNWFFLFVRQLDKNVFTNKDCKMSTSGNFEPLGNLNDSKKIIDTLKNQLQNNVMPIIQCKKDICLCGFCAPKADNKETFLKLIKRNVINDIFLKETNHGKTI